MRFSLTAKIGLLLLVPLLGSLTGVGFFASFFHATRNTSSHLDLAGRQRLVASELYAWAHMVAIGQEEDRAGLLARTAEFDGALAALQRGGQVFGRTIEPAPAEASPALAAVAELWRELKPDLDVVAAASRDDARFGPAYRRVEAGAGMLRGRSHRVVTAIVDRTERLRRRVLRTLAVVAGSALLVFILGLVLTRRYIVRPVLRVREAARRITGGDFSARLDIATTREGLRWGRPDELETLAGTFNEMTAQVERLLAEEKRLAAEVRASERKLQGVLESATDGIVLMGKEGRITYFNRAAEQMFGWSREEVIGAPLTMLMPEQYRPRHVQGLARYLATGASAVLGTVRSFEALRNDRTVFPVDLTVSAYGSDGDVVFAGVVRDVTVQKQLAARTMQMDRMIAVGTLAAGVAHEINNPLSYVVSNLEFIASALSEGGVAPSMAELKAALDEAREGADRVRAILRDVMLFARAEEGPARPLAVSRALDSAVTMAWNEIRHRARLVKDYGLTPAVKADQSRLGQAFLNLLLNAAQAIPEGRAEENQIRIVTRTDETGGVVVEVHDTGGGIPAEVLPRIFDPFFTTRAVGQGTGLGLSVCRGIVTGLGGDITVESEVGKGSTFRVVLPAAPVDLAPRAPAPQAVAPGRRGRILIVDDEPKVARALDRLLAAEHDVVTVTSGREALGQLASEPFDLILCDLMMPAMTGMDLHAELSARMPDYAGRMIFLTGGAFTPRAREFLDQVPNRWIEKPVELAVLRALARDHVG